MTGVVIDEPPLRFLAIGIALGLVAGFLIGSSGVVSVPGTGPDTGAESTISWSSSRGGPTCYQGPGNDTGWIHVLASGETWTTTVNAVVVHPRGTTVETSISRGPTGTYEIALETADAEETKPLPDDCTPATTVTIGASLQGPDVILTMNGRTIESIDQKVTGPRLYRLPQPIHATAKE